MYLINQPALVPVAKTSRRNPWIGYLPRFALQGGNQFLLASH